MKKPRVSPVLAGDDNEDGEGMSLFSSRLTRFKRSPAGLCNFCFPITAGTRNDAPFPARKSQTSDDEELLVPSESIIPAYSHKRSSSCSSESSRRSFATADSDDDSVVPDGTETDELQLEEGKGKAVSRSSLSKGGVSSSSSAKNKFSFLTAAEQREQKEQGEKDDKRAAESPYSFLQDIKDVRNQSSLLGSIFTYFIWGYLERWFETWRAWV